MADPEILRGRIHTGTQVGWVEAVGIADGVVRATGALTAVRAAMPSAAAVRDVETVVPGLVDSHVHVLWGGRGQSEVDVSAATSIEAVLDDLARYARTRPANAWITGDGGFDEFSLRERRMPTIAELDRVAGGRPLLLSRRGHDGLVNSEALHRAGVVAGTPDPPGGHIVRDEAGSPTGLLLERPAVALVEAVLPDPDPDDAAEWIAAAQRPMRDIGIAAVADPALTPAEIGFYVHAWRTGRLLLRTTVFPLGSNELDPEDLDAQVDATGIGDCDPRALRRGPVKLFVDGAGALGTALRREPWPNTASAGIQTTSEETLDRYARWAWREGRGVGVHTVGPRAVEIALDAFERASGGAPWPRGRVHLIHAYLEQDEHLRSRAAALGVGAALQPALNAGVRREVDGRLGGHADMTDAVAWIESGVHCGGGSDGPGLEADPFVFMAKMEERIGRDRAVRFYTGDAGAVIGAPYGTLVPGVPADRVELTGAWERGQLPTAREVVFEPLPAATD